MQLRYRYRLVGFAVLILLTTNAFADDKPLSRTGLQKQRPTSGHFVKTDHGYMVPYKAAIRGTKVRFWMLPVPATISKGKRIEPFWIGKYEVTWAEFAQYMSLQDAIKAEQRIRKIAPPPLDAPDAVTAPTAVYDLALRFQYAKSPRSPAVSMTQFSARQYTKWLSLISREHYRLPTDAEWQHACLAGSKTRWSFGSDEKQVKDYAVFGDMGEGGPEDVGAKKSNAWGIHDMHGNVAEWLATTPPKDISASPPHRNEVRHFVAGGSWLDPADKVTAASRLQSNRDWREMDPNLPQSSHWLASDTQDCVGFRIVSPLKTLTTDERRWFWDADSIQLENNIKDRARDGRGHVGSVDRKTPLRIQMLRQKAQLEKAITPWPAEKKNIERK